MKKIKIMMGVIIMSGLIFAESGLAVDVMGHRGARGLAPENTLPAFAAALSVGVNALELDTAVTKDGVVVVSHEQALNPDLTRDKAGKWLESPYPVIKSLTFAELQQYDVGRLKPNTRYAKAFPEQKAVDGTRIPKLADLFALVRKAGNDKVYLNIEIKGSPLKPEETLSPETNAAMVIELIKKEMMEARVRILSFDWRILRAAQKIAPAIPTVYITMQQPSLDNIAEHNPEGSPWTAGFQYKDYGSVPKMVKATGGAYWSPYSGNLTEAKLKEAQALGVKTVVWTVNDPLQIKRMLDLGVEGIVSDRPDLVRQVMAERGMALPSATPVQP